MAGVVVAAAADDDDDDNDDDDGGGGGGGGEQEEQSQCMSTALQPPSSSTTSRPAALDTDEPKRQNTCQDTESQQRDRKATRCDGSFLTKTWFCGRAAAGAMTLALQPAQCERVVAVSCSGVRRACDSSSHISGGCPVQENGSVHLEAKGRKGRRR